MVKRMFNVLFRAIILFALAYIVIRLMGKRQVGELQPAEFVVALMVADVATMPIGNLSIPIAWSVISLIVLLFAQVLISYVSMKSVAARRLLCGEPTVLISRGIISETALRKQRYNINDLLEQLRSKDVFDVSKVWYALLETNGEISILLRSDSAPVCREDLHLAPPQEELPLLLISDGKILYKNLCLIGQEEKWLHKQMKHAGFHSEKEILLAQYSPAGNLYLHGIGGKKCCLLKVK